MATSVKASIFFTRNLGNFENAKVGYEITTDEFREGETIDQLKARLKAKVEKWIADDIQEIDSGR